MDQCCWGGQFSVGVNTYDVKLGDVGGVPFYIGKLQYEYWKHTQLILDVIEGSVGTFCLEGNTGKAFHTRSRLFTDKEWTEIESIVERDLAWRWGQFPAIRPFTQNLGHARA